MKAETKQEKFQRLFKQYEEENGHAPAGLNAVCRWAVSKGYLDLPPVDPYDVLSSQMGQALRAETAVDRLGRSYRVNYAVKEIMKNGTQIMLWAMMDHASREHMEKAFTLRREQIVSDSYHYKVDVEAYNDKHPEAAPIQCVLNFTDDVAERLVSQAA
jgi:hypothetical protein